MGGIITGMTATHTIADLCSHTRLDTIRITTRRHPSCRGDWQAGLSGA